MRKRIGIYGATDETLQLIPLLEANPEVEIAAIYDPDPTALRERLNALEPEIAETLRGRLVPDDSSLADDVRLHAVIDSGSCAPFASSFPEASERGVQVVTPLAARLLWGYGATSSDRKAELLQVLHEVLESYNLTIDTDELFGRMLEIARSVTSADGGSVMLLDPEARELRVRVATGIEPELWPKIRVPIGDGIAGRVAAEARPLCLRGKADRQSFNIVRERLDVESALSVPLVHEGRVLGVLNLHHKTRADAFSEDDLEFIEQLGRLDAQIIARAQEHEAMRNQATRYKAVREVNRILAQKRPLPERLTELCRFVVAQVGHGIVTLYLYDPDEQQLVLNATSLEGGGFGEEYRIGLDQGIDGTAARTREASFLRREDGGLAYSALPLMSGDTLTGLLSIQAGDDAPRARGAEEFLLDIAAAAADEIASLRREARMTTQATKIGAINEMGIRMISITDPAEVLRMGTSSAAMVLEADSAILRLQDEETGRYVIRSYFGSADGHLQEKLFRLDKRVSVDTIKRRSPLLVRDLAEDEKLRDFGADVRSLIATPLRNGGRVIGTLVIYDKVAADRFAVGNFSDEDLQLFVKFVSYLERAVTNARFYAQARQFRNFDEETGLPNATYLSKRIQEELARADGKQGAMALATCCVENLDEIQRATDPAFVRRVIQRTVSALRAHLRDFDVAGRTGEAEFTVLLPEPGFAPSERIFALARSVADDISKDDALNDPVRVALAFGYAVHPEEGEDRDSLLEQAREPRIRMV